MSERSMSFNFSTAAGDPANNLIAASLNFDGIDEYVRIRVTVPTDACAVMVCDADDLEELGNQFVAFAESMRKATEQAELAREEAD